MADNVWNGLPIGTIGILCEPTVRIERPSSGDYRAAGGSWATMNFVRASPHGTCRRSGTTSRLPLPAHLDLISVFGILDF